MYNNPDHAGTPEAYKSSVVAGGTGNGGNNWTGNLTPGTNVTPNMGALLYPFASSNPLTSIGFSESDVLVSAKLDTTNGTFDVWYTDEHALSLGVRQVNVITASGTTTTNYAVAPLTSDPGAALNPAIGDPAGTDTSGRPIAPSLYVTDITSNPNSLSGDWQYGGAAYNPSAVFGAWKGAVQTVNETTSPATVTVTCDADPAKNGSNLGAGADTPSVSVGGEGYSAEVRWDLNALYSQGVLQAGHTYRFYVMVHDGDQNKSGGDAGQAAFDYSLPGSPISQLSGAVSDTSGNPLSGATLTLNEIINGQAVVVATTMTGSAGTYSFGDLQGGNYFIAQAPPPGYFALSATRGTVNNVTDGTAASSGSEIDNIVLVGGNNGVNYNFVDTTFGGIG